jgi:hypothetical protein
VIPLEEGTKVQNAEDDIKKPHSFAVTTTSKSYTVHERLEWDKRTYYFVAKDDKEKLEWMLAIQRAKPALRNQVRCLFYFLFIMEGLGEGNVVSSPTVLGTLL